VSRQARVLLVDDNAALVDNLTDVLGEEGYEVVTAGTAAEALKSARSGYEVALVDVRLPDSDGTALAEQLRDLSPESAVVLLTGFAALETAIAAVRAGAFAYLVKPCSTPDLLLTVEQALRQVRLHEEKRELMRRALVAEKLAAVGTMTAGLSHEIRNPLNAAGLQLSVLERRVKRLVSSEQEPLLEPLRLVRDEIGRLEHLLEDFLQFARPRELKLQEVDLAQLIESVAGFLSGDAERRGVALEQRIATPPLAAAADPDRLRQVLMNLALNALEATPKGGRVRVEAGREGTDVFFAVEDSGPGIEPAARSRLFEPFFTTKPSGSGLGLAIVHAIVTQHGGAVRITDSALGGARFAVALPRAR
jgi:two-component system, NtrC family, sensor histidine kinase HydH